MNKKRFIILFSILIVLFFVYISFISSNQLTGNSSSEERKQGNPIKRIIEDGKFEISKRLLEFPADLREDQVQSAIHHMSHTKVYAEEKWGSLKPTQERIDRLIIVVEENRDQYNHAELYLDILKNWQAGDFSHAVSDHNMIWNLQGGTIGEATRLLAENEE
ncbi:DUF6241 domain-containing protein [Bacillus marasmi]|uniref:DUF6241 domain-containing protein n=1 Tax=Bacillus marasmi TaxID=1926279 RepID=UPI0011CC3B28|nr:DUF6241 domain-containing protein [Bacillus marasmi]